MPVPEPQPVHTIFVDDDAAAGGNGSSWEKAFNHLDDALRLAQSTQGRDHVYVMVGTYTPGEAGTPQSSSFELPDGVELYGGFEDESQLRPDDRTGLARDTVLTGDLNRDDHSGRRGDNAWHVVTVAGTGNIRLDRFTVTAGHADGVSGSHRNTGGGLLVTGADGLKIHNVVIAGNSADLRGGGLAVYDSTNVRVGDSTIVENKALNGGGVYVEDSQVGLSDTKLADNRSTGGGAIDAHHSRLTLRGVKAAGNSAIHSASDQSGGHGGAIRLVNSSVLIQGGMFSENHGQVYGGALYAIGSDVHVEGTSFLTNTAGSGAGAIALDGSTFHGTRMTIADNAARNAAGGIGALHSDVTVTESVFRANSAARDFGGALAVVGAGDDHVSTLQSSGNTFHGNRAAGEGGAVYVLNTNYRSRDDQFLGNTAAQNGGAIRIDEIDFEENEITPVSVRPDLNRSLLPDRNAEKNPVPVPVPLPAAWYHSSIHGAHFKNNVAMGQDHATSLSGLGGGIFALTDLSDVSHLSVSISDSRFISNAARNGGAIVLGNVDGARISRSGFNGNRARALPVSADDTAPELNGDGGAILVGLADLNVSESLFSGNRAGGSGGAVYVVAGGIQIDRSRLNDNAARAGGGAIFVDQQSQTGLSHSELSGNSAGENGGAVAVRDAKLVVNSAAFNNNSAHGAGGALAAEQGRIRVGQSTFEGNTAGLNGGAVAASDGSTVDLVFVSLAENASRGDGGAVAATDGSSASVTGGTFTRNGAWSTGGAVYAGRGSTASVDGATLTGNVALSGGAIAADDSAVSVERSVMNRNQAVRSGGAIAAVNSRVGVKASLVINNHAGEDGGAVALKGSQLYTKASVYGANSARNDGGAIAAKESLAVIDGCFFISNVAGRHGGAISLLDSTAGVINSVFDGNQAEGAGSAIFAKGSSLSLNNNRFGQNQDIVALP